MERFEGEFILRKFEAPEAIRLREAMER